MGCSTVYQALAKAEPGNYRYTIQHCGRWRHLGFGLDAFLQVPTQGRIMADGKPRC